MRSKNSETETEQLLWRLRGWNKQSEATSGGRKRKVRAVGVRTFADGTLKQRWIPANSGRAWILEGKINNADNKHLALKERFLRKIFKTRRKQLKSKAWIAEINWWNLEANETKRRSVYER